jgi:hypothetical protein
MQNDVNKTALAAQAQLGAGVAGALAGASASAVAACVHAAAHQGDRYCAACGAALPARG